MTLTFDALIKGYWLYISKGYQISTYRKIPIPQSLQIIQTSQNLTFINIQGAKNLNKKHIKKSKQSLTTTTNTIITMISIHNRGRHHYYIKQ